MSNIVRNGHPPVGTHLVVNLYDVYYGELLKYVWIGRPALDHVINELHLNVVNESHHQFEPYGYTMAYILAESHMTIHTYPEYHAAYLDIFSCSPSFNPMTAIRVLKDTFQTETATFQVIYR